MAPEPIPAAPAPWVLKSDIYTLPLWVSASQARSLPPQMYSPLEGASDFATTPLQRPVGGLALVQIIRYHETPVGPYDELAVGPGPFAWRREDATGKVAKKGKSYKITRMYVSQKNTCYNGRTNWNMPKHLAKFEWDHKPDGSMTVKIFPHDTHNDQTESTPSTTPLFFGSFKPMRYVPSFPVSTKWMSYLGQDLTLVQPPLPQGQGGEGELPGTDQWCSVFPLQKSKRTVLGWFDLQPDGKAKSEKEDAESFWPGLGRWYLGAKMENTITDFGVPEKWTEEKKTTDTAKM